MKDYGTIVGPLTSLLKKDSFSWTEEATTTLDALRLAMVILPVLALPDFSIPFTVETVASGYGLGVVLSQKGSPIAFFSQALNLRAQSRSVYERELMAIVLAVQKWSHYLLGQKFTVLTDQRALQNLLEQREIQPEYQKWLTKLLGYDFEIKYHPSLLNKIVDALSRVTPTSELMSLSVPSLIDIETVKSDVEQDVELQKIRQELQEDPLRHPKYSLDHGILHHKG